MTDYVGFAKFNLPDGTYYRLVVDKKQEGLLEIRKCIFLNKRLPGLPTAYVQLQMTGVTKVLSEPGK
jgi:hypothetical protein